MDCHDRHDCNGNCNTYLPPSARLLHRSVLYRTFSRTSRHRTTLHLVLVEEQITPDSPIPIRHSSVFLPAITRKVFGSMQVSPIFGPSIIKPETMEEKQKFPSHAGSGKVLTASLFILSGLLLFARNMGIITKEWFNMLALLIYNSRYLYHDTQALSVRRCPIAGGTLPLGKQTHAIPRQFPSHAVALGPYPHRHFLSQTSP